MRNPYQKRNKATSEPTLGAKERYVFFIQKMIVERKVWGLYEDGWAVCSTSDGLVALAVWPEKQYAQLCQNRSWVSHTPKEIHLKAFIEQFLPYAHKKNAILSIFMTPDGQSVLVKPEQLAKDISNYLQHLYVHNRPLFDALGLKNPNTELQDDAHVQSEPKIDNINH